MNFEFIKVVKEEWEQIETLPKISKEKLVPFKEQLIDYARKMPLGKKLFYYLNHEISQSTLFIDSDVLFYNLASVVDLAVKDTVMGLFR